MTARFRPDVLEAYRTELARRLERDPSIDYLAGIDTVPPPVELERVRNQTLTAISQAQKNPSSIAARVAYVPGTGFYADGSGHGFMRLNFSFPPPERIREGVRRLAGGMEQEIAMRQVFGAVPGVGRRGQAGADVPGPDLA